MLLQCQVSVILTHNGVLHGHVPQLSGRVDSCQGELEAVRESVKLSGRVSSCQGKLAAVRVSWKLSGRVGSCQGELAAVRSSPIYSMKYHKTFATVSTFFASQTL